MAVAAPELQQVFVVLSLEALLHHHLHGLCSIHHIKAATSNRGQL
jgi:hypothetical protein